MVEVEVVIFEVIERKVMIGVGELELKRGFFIFFFLFKIVYEIFILYGF